MQASPNPIKPGPDPYRMRQRPLTVDEIAEIAAHLHIAHLTELQRLRDFQRRFEWSQDHQYVPKPRKQIVRLSSRLDHLPQPTLVPWRPVVVPRNLQELFDTVPKAQAGAGQPEAGSVWRAARGWAGGALLLLAALFLVRATDRFFTKNYSRWRRTRSEEWPTPNVLATSHRSTFVDIEPPHELDAIPSESSGSSQELFTNDLPPPYSECSADDANKHKYEEPPPPYSACYVEFSNPKDGIPAVHFFSRHRQILDNIEAGTSRNNDVNGVVANNDATSNDASHVTSNDSLSDDTGQSERNVDGNNVELRTDSAKASTSKPSEVC